ncbi:Kelch repeat-containing protein [Oligoflexus tunisiensis]|uniref:Kelch repeat-containing protein n=1 Tax=Oligoflexus tunisiensis TaxID=708132 RepID=UPI00159F05D2|nr:kelch repeat-containing protein [Oligoflexus tunisiensis]
MNHRPDVLEFDAAYHLAGHLKVKLLFKSISLALVLTSCQTVPPTLERKIGWTFHPAPAEFGPVAHSSCGVIEGTILAFGGINPQKASPLNSDLVLYDDRTGDWQQISAENGPVPRNFTSYAVFDQALYIFGGETAYSNAVADAFSYDIRSRSWTALPRHRGLIPRKQASLTRVGKSLVLFGGQGLTRITNWGRYDVDSRSWRTFPAEPGMEARVSHIALSVGESKLFVWGGFIGQERRGDGFLLDVKSGESLDIASTSTLAPRANARAVHMGGDVFIWGGATEDGDSNTGSSYDLDRRQWRSLPPIPDARYAQLRAAEIAPWGTQGFLLFGGRFGTEDFNDQLWFFDVGRREWSLLRSNESPSGRMAHCFVALGPNRFAVFGGMGYAKGSQSLEHKDGIWIYDGLLHGHQDPFPRPKD